MARRQRTAIAFDEQSGTVTQRIAAQWRLTCVSTPAGDIQRLILEPWSEGDRRPGITPAVLQHVRLGQVRRFLHHQADILQARAGQPLEVHLEEGVRVSDPVTARPKRDRGRPQTNAQLYRRALSDYEALVQSGGSTEALARHYKVKHTTFRSWIHRAREQRARALR